MDRSVCAQNCLGGIEKSIFVCAFLQYLWEGKEKNLFSILRPQQSSKWSSVKEPHPNPQLWANKTQRASVLAHPIPALKGGVTQGQAAGLGTLTQPQLWSQPLSRAGRGSWRAPGDPRRSPCPCRLSQGAPAQRRDSLALLRQRAIAEFSCPGYFFPSSMNHLLKIL